MPRVWRDGDPQWLSASVLRALENRLVTAQVAAASVNTKRREMLRLALAAVAGKWAVEVGVLPHTADEVLDTVRCVREHGSVPRFSSRRRTAP